MKVSGRKGTHLQKLPTESRCTELEAVGECCVCQISIAASVANLRLSYFTKLQESHGESNVVVALANICMLLRADAF